MLIRCRWLPTTLALGCASAVLGVGGCAAEDEPDLIALDATPDVKRDVSSNPDVGNCPGPGDAGRDDAMVAEGRALVESLGCPRCHQDEAADAGLFLSGRLVPTASGSYPRNLTPDPATGLGCWTDPQIVEAILNGIRRDGRELCRMPKFANRIDAEGAQQIVAFLRSLDAVNKEIPATMCPPPADASPDRMSDAAHDGDARIDAGMDGEPPADAGRDGAPDADAGIDSGPPDAGTDAEPPGDAGTDAPGEGGADGGPPGDGGTGDAPGDAPGDGGSTPDSGSDAAPPDAGSDGDADGAVGDVVTSDITVDVDLDSSDSGAD